MNKFIKLLVSSKVFKGYVMVLITIPNQQCLCYATHARINLRYPAAKRQSHPTSLTRPTPLHASTSVQCPGHPRRYARSHFTFQPPTPYTDTALTAAPPGPPPRPTLLVRARPSLYANFPVNRIIK